MPDRLSSIRSDGPPGFSLSDDNGQGSVADRFGVKVQSRQSIRLAVQYRSDLERFVRTTRRTGTLLVFYSQGTPAGCGWEEVQ